MLSGSCSILDRLLGSKVAAIALAMFLSTGCLPNRIPGSTMHVADAGKVLPVHRVMIFRNGVAYIERRGRFQGSVLRLKVSRSQIGDILKTITVIDFSGGHARSLSLPVDMSSKRALATLPKLGLGTGDLSEVMKALRGASVRVGTSRGSVTGRLAGFEQTSDGYRIGVLQEDGAMVLVDSDSIESLKILDSTLERGLEKGLDIAMASDTWGVVDLDIYLDGGAGEHDLSISYLVEMPVWKPTYRLVLDKDKDKALLQAWAVVDNVTGSDWKNVQLVLTTGSPVSFHYDLYTPKFMDRPDLTPKQVSALAPPSPSSAAVQSSRPGLVVKSAPAGRGLVRTRRSYAERQSIALGSTKAPEMEQSMDDYGLADAQERTYELMSQNVSVRAQTMKIGEAYSFAISEPMTVPDRSSTMVAILNENVPGEPVYYYDPQPGVEDTKIHPFKAVRISNVTDVPLEGGPLSVILDGGFAGEGLMGRLEKGNESYIAYALATGVNVEYSVDTSNPTAGLVKIRNGIVETRYYSVRRHSYRIKASAADVDKLTFIASVAKRPGWKIEVKGGKLLSEAGDKRFFAVQVEPGSTVRMLVREKYPMLASYRITDKRAQRAIEVYVTSREASEEIKEKLAPLMKKMKELNILSDRISTLQKQRKDLSKRAQEIRDNLKLLKTSRNKALKKAQTRKLVEVDRKLSKLTDQLVQARTRLGEVKVELSNMVESLNIEF